MMSAKSMRMQETVEVSVDVINTSDLAGEEVVQFYIRDHYASAMRPMKELKGFKKVKLLAGETKTVTFIVNWETLAFYGADEVFKAEPGMFDFMIGANSRDVEVQEFELTH